MKETYKYSYKVGEKQLNSLSVYNVGHQKCESGYQWGPGIRNHYCIHHVISGAGYYEVGGQTIPLAAGDTFILYPDTEVKYYADNNDPWEYAWVGFMGADAASIIRSTDFTRETPFIQRDNLPKEIIRRQLEEIYTVKGNTYEAAVAMTGLLYTFLSIFMKYASNTDSARDVQQVYVEKAKDYISTSYSYPITIEDVAAYAGISRSYLFRAFQNHLKQSPKEYLTDFRIKQACHLLKGTDLSIAAIAYSVGVENNLYFSKAFKNKMQVSPSQYRKKYREML